MDLPNRDSYEDRLSTRIDRAFATVRRVALTGRTPDAGVLEREVQSAIEDQARAVYIVMFLLFLEDEVGKDRIEPSIFNRLETTSARRAEEVGSQRGREIGLSIADDLRAAIKRGATPQEIADEFDATRARTIGVTETTALASWGYTDAVDETAAATDQTLEVWWVTAKDDRVCPICGPLHAKPRRVWSEAFPNGPPAHPNCRCTIDITRAW